jgi:hypothetical protein
MLLSLPTSFCWDDWFRFARAWSSGVWSFAMTRHTNHQDIPRMNARARRARRDGHAYLKRSTCSTWIMYTEHIVLRTMYVQTETSHSLSERKSNMPTAFVTGKRQPGFINRLFPVRRCRIMPKRFITNVPETPCNVVWKTKSPKPHIMPSVSLNSKPTGFFRILKRFLFSFSLSVV